MKIRSKLLGINFAGCIALMCVGGFSILSFQRVSMLWIQYQEVNSKKSELLHRIYAKIGYGGVIHNFKNYVIRGEEKYFNTFKQKSEETKSIVREYKSIEDSIDTERRSLDSLLNFIDEYDIAINIARDLWVKEKSFEDLLFKIKDSLKSYVFRRDRKHLSQFTLNLHDFENILEEYDAMSFLSPVEKISIRKTREMMNQYFQIVQTSEMLKEKDSLLEEIDSKIGIKDRPLLKSMVNLITELDKLFVGVKDIDALVRVDDSYFVDAIESLSKEVEKVSSQATKNFLLLVKKIGLIITVIVILSIVLIFILGVGVFLMINRQMKLLISRIKNNQDTKNSNIPLPVSNDEFGELAHSFNQLMEGLKITREDLEEKTMQLSSNLENIKKQNRLLEDARHASINMLQELGKEKVKIEENEIKTQAVFETVVDGIIVISEGGIIDSLNKAAEKIFGYQEEEVIGKNIKILMPEPYQSEHDGYLSAYKKTGCRKIIGFGREVLGRRKNGMTFPMDLSVNEMDFRSKKMFAGVVRDITERKEANDQLVQQKVELEKINKELKSLDEMKTNFLSTISHELRTPLTSILGNTKLIVQRYEKMPDLDKKEFLKTTVRQGEHLLNLVNDILDVAKAESGHLKLEKVQLDLKEIVEISVESVRILADERGVSLKWDILTRETMIFADPARLQQILINLLGNAIKFTSQGEEIVVKIENYVHSEDVLLISVIDNGVGIPEDKIKILFNRFAQVDNTPTREAGGTGLGLAIVKELVHLHGGRIWVESEVGKGSAFIFTILKFEKFLGSMGA